jgi:FeS assembly SUF system protein
VTERAVYEPTDELEEAAEPPLIEAPLEHPLWPAIKTALRTVFDPEIPVNIYELGLIYKVVVTDDNDAKVDMSLTAPGCPVAGEMPGMVQEALRGVEGLRDAEVELVWEPGWDPSRMADTAKLQLNMY